MTTTTKINLGKNGPLVSKLGLGCMRMSSVWGGPVNDERESIATIQMALDSGINFLNTGDFYGAGHNWKDKQKFVVFYVELLGVDTVLGISFLYKKQIIE